MFEQLEKRILAKITAIKNKTITPAESGIGKLLNLMSSIDEPAYNDLLGKYKSVVGA